MPTQTRSFPGKVMDIETKQLIAEEIVYLTLVIPTSPDKLPELEGSVTIKGFKPEYSDKQFILELPKKTGEIFSGQIRLIMPVVTQQDFDLKLMKFIIIFEDNIWRTQQFLEFLRN